MAKFIVLAFIAAFAFQGVLGKPKSKTTPAPVEQSTLDEVAANAKKAIDDLKKDLPDTDQVVNTLNQKTKEAADVLNKLSTKLNNEFEAHKPEMNNAIKHVSEKINEAVTTLQNSLDPKTKAKATELSNTLTQNLKGVYAEFDKFIKASEPDVKKTHETFSGFMKTALEQMETYAKSATESLDKVIKDHEKSHKN